VGADQRVERLTALVDAPDEMTAVRICVGTLLQEVTRMRAADVRTVEDLDGRYARRSSRHRVTPGSTRRYTGLDTIYSGLDIVSPGRA
jgi:hypothetical protein